MMRAVQDGSVVELPASPYFNQGYGCIGKDTLVSEFPYLIAGEDPAEARAKAREDMAAQADETGDTADKQAEEGASDDKGDSEDASKTK